MRTPINIPEYYIKECVESGVSSEGCAQLLACNGIHVSPRTCRKRMAEYKLRTPPRSDELPKMNSTLGGVLSSPERGRKRLQGRKFVFTTAQSGTAIHDEFFSALKRYCEFNNATLVVGGITYNTRSDSAEFAEPLQPYLLRESAEIAHGIVWCGEVQISPTATDPLSSLDSYTIGNSGVFPHTKVRLKSLPRMHEDEPRFQYTTGCCTLRNYSDTKTGLKASFHHVYGALVVEVDSDGDWFARHLIAGDDGSFYDLDTRYTSMNVIPVWDAVYAITMGDMHFPTSNASLWKWIEDWQDVFRTKFWFLHDVLDFKVQSHHNRNDFFHKYNHLGCTATREFQETQKCLEMFLDTVGHYTTNVVVVHGNHDAAFDRWLREVDYRDVPADAEFILESTLTLLRHPGYGDTKLSAFAVLMSKALEDAGYNAIFLQPDESFALTLNDTKPIECGIHGHSGIGGAKGTPSQYTKIGRRANTGHTHTAGILDGVYTAGTSTEMDLNYNYGLTTWSNSHIFTYKNGKRTIITCKGDKWRG